MYSYSKESRIKMTGRKTSVAYELYGFIPKVENGKHSAICKSCNRVLQNTAAVRLQKHRNSCVATRTAVTRDQVHYPNVEFERNGAPNEEAEQHNEASNFNVKTEHNNMEYCDANINDNANDDTSYEDTMEVTNPLKIEHKTAKNDETTDFIYTKPHKSNHQRHNAYSYQTEDPIQPPEVATQEHLLEPFESYQETHNTISPAINIDDNMQDEVSDEDLINVEEELDVIQNLMPRSKEWKQLQHELSKAETEYYRCKAAYFTKLTENCKIKRTLMLLESRKLQLEIEKLSNEA